MATTPANQLDAIRSALALLPAKAQTMPEPLAGMLAVRSRLAEALPDAGSEPRFAVARRLAEHTDPATVDDLLVELERMVARADLAAAAWSGGYTQARDRATAQAAADALPELTSRLRPVFDAAAQALHHAAATLPTGAAALDPATVLAADAETGFREARSALSTIRTIAAVFVAPLRTDGTTPLGATIVAVVDVPDCGPLRWDGLHDGGGTLNDPDDLARLNGIQQLVKDYQAAPDLALLDVTRDAYPGVSLSLAATPADMAARVERVSTAHTRIRVTEGARSRDGQAA